jgi:hypothetical protein
VISAENLTGDEWLIYAEGLGSATATASCSEGSAGTVGITVISADCDNTDPDDGGDDGDPEWVTECSSGGDEVLPSPDCGWYTWQIQDPYTHDWHDVGNPFLLCPGDIPPRIDETRIVPATHRPGHTIEGKPMGSSARAAGGAEADIVATRKFHVTVLGVTHVDGKSGVEIHRDPARSDGAIILIDAARATSLGVGGAVTGVAYLAFGGVEPAAGARLDVGVPRSRDLRHVRSSSQGQRILDKLSNSKQTGKRLGRSGKIVEFDVEQSRPVQRPSR